MRRCYMYHPLSSNEAFLSMIQVRDRKQTMAASDIKSYYKQ